MHEPPSGMPAHQPSGSIPPPPAFPPAYPPALPPSLPPTRPSRTGLWIALGVVGAIVLAGTAFAVTRPGDTAPDAILAGAGAAPDAGSRTMGRLHLPDTFLGMARDDDAPEAAALRQQIEAMVQDDPHAHAVVTSYKSGRFGENHVFVIAVESDVPFSEKDRADALDGINDGSVDTPGMKVTHGEVRTVDPGPLGGVMKCKVTYTKTDAADAFGTDLFSATNCAWLDGNTYVTVTEGNSATGHDLTKAADHARQFRAEAETRR